MLTKSTTWIEQARLRTNSSNHPFIDTTDQAVVMLYMAGPSLKTNPQGHPVMHTSAPFDHTKTAPATVAAATGNKWHRTTTKDTDYELVATYKVKSHVRAAFSTLYVFAFKNDGLMNVEFFNHFENHENYEKVSA